MGLTRFDFVKYDEKAVRLSETFKEKFNELENKICCLEDRRERTNAMDALEECSMWIGKTIRAEQIERNKGNVELEDAELIGRVKSEPKKLKSN